MTWRSGNSGGVTYVNCTYQTWADNGTPSTPTTLVSMSDSWNSSSFAGASTPGFHRRVRAGELLPFNYWWKKEVVFTAHCHPHDFRKTGTQWRQLHTPWPPFNGTETAWWVLGIEDNALTTSGLDAMKYVSAAAAKCYSQGFDVGTFLGELKDTRRMFESLGKRLVGLTTNFAKYSPKASYAITKAALRNLSFGRVYRYVQRRTKQAGNAYLEGRYGWRPLVSDLNNLAHAVEMLSEKITRVSQTAGTSVSWKSDSGEYISGQDTTRIVYNRKVREYTVGARGIVAADFAPSPFYINPFTTAWELTKFSFVVDWFVGIGDWLEAMSLMVSARSWTAANGYKIECLGTATGRSVGKAPYYYYGDTSLAWVTQSKITIRNPCSIPKFPSIRLKLDAYKVADLLAILRQSIRS